MSELAHLLRADVRRHRLLLSAWLLVVVAAALTTTLRPAIGATSAVKAAVDPLATILWLTQPLLLMMVVALVVQTHPLVGSTAFWMTRPIRPHALLAAKAALLVSAVVIVPILAQLATMAAYRVPTGVALAVAFAACLDLCVVVVFAMSVAALTANFARFALTVGGLLVATIIGLATAASIMAARMDEGDFAVEGIVAVGVNTGSVPVLSLLTIASGVLLLVVQYRTRRRPRSIAVGLIGCAVAVMATGHWPWPATPQLELPHWAIRPGRPRLLLADSTSVETMDQTAGVGTRRWRPVRAGLRLDGVEPGWSAEVYLRGATVDIAGRGRLAMTKRDTAMMLVRSNVPVEGVDDNPIRLASRQVLGVTRLADGNAPLGESATILNVPEDAFRRFAPSIGHYFGRFEIVPTRYEIECVLPIEKGSTHQRGSYRVVVERVLRGPGVLIAEIRQSMAWSPFDRRARPLRRFYLRNRGAAAAMEGSVDDHDRNDFAVFGLAVSSDTGFSAQRLRVSFPPSHGLQGDSFTLDDRWLDGAELVIVSATMAQPLVRTIEIQSLPLRMPQPEHPAQ